MKPSDSFVRHANRILLAIDDFREEHASSGGTRDERRPFTLALLEIASLALAEAERVRSVEQSNIVHLCDFRPAQRRVFG